MPDAIQPVGAMIQPIQQQNPLDMYSKLLGIQQQQAAIPGVQAESSMRTRANAQQAALASENWADPKYHNEDGSLNDEAVQSRALQLAPGEIGSSFATHIIEMNKGAAETKKAWLGLDTETQNLFRQDAGAWSSNPDSGPAELSAQLDERVEDAPASMRGYAKQVADHYRRILGVIPKMVGDQADNGVLPQGADQQKEALKRMKLQVATLARGGLQQESLTGPGGVGTPNVGVASTGAPYSQSRSTGNVTPAGGSVPMVETMALPNGQIARLNKGTNKYEITEAATGKSHVPKTAPAASGAPKTSFYRPDGSPRTVEDDAPGPNAPAAAQKAYTDSSQEARDYVTAVRSADENYGQNHNISDVIRRLASSTRTGPGTQAWHSMLGTLGAPLELQNVADYQQLGSFLDRQAAGLRQTMGLPGTNQGQSTAENISGNTSLQQNAILAKNEFNQALVEGLHNMRNGLDKVEGFTGRPSPQTIQRYRSMWTQNFDPSIYELENAKRRLSEDPKAVEKAAATIPQGQGATLKKKRAALRMLSIGQMPAE